jgi:hypothetical protein
VKQESLNTIPKKNGRYRRPPLLASTQKIIII